MFRAIRFSWVVGGRSSTPTTFACATLKLVNGKEVKKHRGPSIYDVRKQGGGGVRPKEDGVREVA